MAFRVHLPSPLNCLNIRPRPLPGTLYLALVIVNNIWPPLPLILNRNATALPPANPVVPASRPTSIRRKCRTLARRIKELAPALKINWPFDLSWDTLIDDNVRSYSRIIL